jgi:hypothetical protein
VVENCKLISKLTLATPKPFFENALDKSSLTYLTLVSPVEEEVENFDRMFKCLGTAPRLQHLDLKSNFLDNAKVSNIA